ncbi:DUF2268 domain-containing putative Zn-dependent protease [Paenibacillus alkalitolerans]|uniref:DUF2268 domain-containing putative Zn-dependent protease n=1 Tax=Paenibacillus alkalitolerans TaxID=2799335 RepID=UPI0018F64578|nr:DUF2268 domain-containing putative Zn-dependent protease [Paenibacillus alkalitolerans]
MNITVNNYIPDLINLNDFDYTEYLNSLIEELSYDQPHKWMIKGSIKNASIPFVSIQNRDQLFQRLIEFDLSHIAHETVKKVSALLPCSVGEVNLHIIPAIESKGGGACYSPGNILLAIRIDELSPVRLQRNIAHEYSHTVRLVQKPTETEFGFGEAVQYKVRDYLIFEGLANVFPELLFSHPNIHAPEVTEQQEVDFWNTVDLEAEGIEGYINNIGLRAYEIGSRIIRHYLNKHGTTIEKMHYSTDDELFWNSGYPYIKR